MKQHAQSQGIFMLVCLGLASHCDDALASTGPMLDFLYGYLSIYLVIPVLIFLPLIREWIRRDRAVKTENETSPKMLLVTSIGCLVLDAAFGWWFFEFNFKGPIGMSGEDGWWALYFLVIPPYFLTTDHADSRKRDSS